MMPMLRQGQRRCRRLVVTQCRRFGIAVVAAALSLMSLTSCSSPTTPPTSTPRPSPSPSAQPSTVFAFENDEASPATWTFLDSEGAILHTLITTPSAGTFDPLSNLYNYVGASSAILARSNGISPNTQWSVVHSDGTASPVAVSLTPLLNEVSASNFPGNFLVAPFHSLRGRSTVPRPSKPLHVLGSQPDDWHGPPICFTRAPQRLWLCPLRTRESRPTGRSHLVPHF